MIRVASVTLDTSFLNFLLNLYTCFKDKHAFTVLQLHAAIGLLVSLTKKWITECCSSYMHASNRATIFACSAVMMSALRDLPYTVHASNSYCWLTVPKVVHNTVLILSALLRFSFDSLSYEYMGERDMKRFCFVIPAKRSSGPNTGMDVHSYIC
jgi:hypothetical protein